MASLSVEEENYVRMSLLLTGISTRAARIFFDTEFAPACLDASIKKEYNTLLDLKKKHRINQSQWNLLFPRFPDFPDSKTFDLSLMITLLRNLAQMNPPLAGFDNLPSAMETTSAADLARIKHYRNYLAHVDEGKINTIFLNTAWTDITSAIDRLGGQQMKQECDHLKIKPLDQTNQEIRLDIKRSNDEIKDLKESFESLKQSHTETKKSHELLQEHHAEVKTSHEILQDDHTKVKKSHQILQDDHTKVKKSHEILQDDYTKVKKSHEILQDDHTKVKKSHEILQDDHTKVKKSHESLQDDHRKVRKSHEILQDDHRKVTKEMEEIKTSQEDTVPWNIRAIISDTLKDWKDNDEKMFISTRAAQCVLGNIKQNNCVTITASSGVGKTATLRHVALQMAEKEEYDVLIVTEPGEILRFYNPNKKTLFVVDDLCGNFSIDQSDIKRWKPILNNIKKKS